MNLVTAEELDGRFGKVLEVLESIGVRLSMFQVGNSRQEYFSRVEAAEYLRMSVSKLDQLSADGLILRAKLGEGSSSIVLFRRCDLDDFVKSCVR